MATKNTNKKKAKGVSLNMRPRNYSAVIKVVGVGGGGTNAVNRMEDSQQEVLALVQILRSGDKQL